MLKASGWWAFGSPVPAVRPRLRPPCALSAASCGNSGSGPSTSGRNSPTLRSRSPTLQVRSPQLCVPSPSPLWGAAGPRGTQDRLVGLNVCPVLGRLALSWATRRSSPRPSQLALTAPSHGDTQGCGPPSCESPPLLWGGLQGEPVLARTGWSREGALLMCPKPGWSGGRRLVRGFVLLGTGACCSTRPAAVGWT